MNTHILSSPVLPRNNSAGHLKTYIRKKNKSPTPLQLRRAGREGIALMRAYIAARKRHYIEILCSLGYVLQGGHIVLGSTRPVALSQGIIYVPHILTGNRKAAVQSAVSLAARFHFNQKRTYLVTLQVYMNTVLTCPNIQRLYHFSVL